ncbi:hypothetical protein N7510_009480 [Penicillium lagena]|uniref:uncharacterized protein n=1 Tax=Penicillium lagena TaxID=94218 RepID=UPI0025417AC1|nr:uncharacterized protein N7510_009480 [Penicillium lagena]KAJ5606699.1 hypothetical protein N7510_009480 [Penicillium lagena]
MNLECENTTSTKRGVYLYRGSIIYLTRHHKAKLTNNWEFYVARFLPSWAGHVVFYYLAYIRPFVGDVHQPFNRFDDQGPNVDLNVAFAWQSGHRPIARATNYGLDGAFPTQLQPSLLRAYEWVSTRWHEFLRQGSKSASQPSSDKGTTRLGQASDDLGQRSPQVSLVQELRQQVTPPRSSPTLPIGLSPSETTSSHYHYLSIPPSVSDLILLRYPLNYHLPNLNGVNEPIRPRHLLNYHLANLNGSEAEVYMSTLVRIHQAISTLTPALTVR